jgi:hypothetical protein
VAALTLALSQLIWLSFADVSWLVYTHIWAVYLAGAAWYVRQVGGTRDTYHVVGYLALTVLTLPVVIDALGDSPYGALLLLLEQSAILVIGVVSRRRLVAYWGAVVLIGTVLYLLRALGYLQLILIAFAFITYAVLRLLRHRT